MPESAKAAMASCREDTGCELAVLRLSHSRVLWVVLAINGAMFLVESTAGRLAHSSSLLADALVMLGDAWGYGFSLFMLSRSAWWQAGAALAKGASMLALGLGVLGGAAYEAWFPIMPGLRTMGLVGSLALLANPVAAKPGSRRRRGPRGRRRARALPPTACQSARFPRCPVPCPARAGPSSATPAAACARRASAPTRRARPGSARPRAA